MIELLEAQGAFMSAGHTETAEAVMLAWAAYTQGDQPDKAAALAADFVRLREEALP